MKSHPVYKSLIFATMFAFDFGLYSLGVIKVRAGWFIAGTLVAIFGRYFIAGLVDRPLGEMDASPM